MINTNGFAVHDAEAKFEPFAFERRDVGPSDILIEILFAGICHSDIHQARGEWGNSTYPMVPGHEIVGKVTQVGSEVTKFAVGDIAGIGCMVDSCRECEPCRENVEQFCVKGAVMTYNGTEMDRETMTFGGYSTNYVVDEAYALKVDPSQDLKAVAPLLCAGITTYSPLRRFKAGPGKKVGVVGLGGLGHMAVKLAAAMGAEVTVFSTSPSKEADARRLGADHFVITSDPANLKPLRSSYDLLIDAVSAEHDLNLYLNLLKIEGHMVLVGLPEKPIEIRAFALLGNNRSLVGSSIGGIKETQEMLDFCAEHNIVSDVEMILPDQIETAYDRTVKADVKYRFVIDMQNV
ncbi:MAG TPA: NAD(P)-dependent alcohol dehydrogenase [Pyrinomonadaceae bacterium]|nr:NAD(P)-dependent alcohol dehydrogenase [Pyrinomonadaceae bacterium]